MKTVCKNYFYVHSGVHFLFNRTLSTVQLRRFRILQMHTHTHTHNTLETSAPYFLEFVGAASRGFFLLSQSTYKTTVFYDFYSNGRLAPMIIVTDFVKDFVYIVLEIVRPTRCV